MHWLAVLILCLCLGARAYGEGNPSPAEEIPQDLQGSESSGGGDPLASDFLLHAREIQFAYAEQEKAPTALFGRNLSLFIERLENSLEGHSPRLVFQPGASVDCFGATKLACVGQDGVIRVAREGWLAASPEMRLGVTHMELMIANGAQGRYEASDLIRQIRSNRVQGQPEGESPLQERAGGLFSRGRTVSAAELANTRWACDAFHNLSNRHYSDALNFSLDPASGDLLNRGLIAASKENTVSYNFRVSDNGDLANAAGTMGIRRLASGALIIQSLPNRRLNRSPAICEEGCGTRAAGPLSSVREAGQEIVHSLGQAADTGAHYLCYVQEVEVGASQSQTKPISTPK